jgi:hypothetical protein
MNSCRNAQRLTQQRFHIFRTTALHVHYGCAADHKFEIKIPIFIDEAIFLNPNREHFLDFEPWPSRT